MPGRFRTGFRSAGADGVRPDPQSTKCRMNSPSPTNHDPLHDPLEDTDVDINDKLIAELGLTGDSIEKIYEVMRSMGNTFADAAGRLGLLRPDAFEQALLKIKAGHLGEDAAEDAGMVETAIRRIAAD